MSKVSYWPQPELILEIFLNESCIEFVPTILTDERENKEMIQTIVIA